MSTREQLIDLNVYGKGMETHVKIKSPIIGDWVKSQAARSFGDIQYAKIPTSVAKTFEGGVLKIMLPEVIDPRDGGNYGRFAWDNRGHGMLQLSSRGFSGRTTPNPSILLIEGISEGLHIVFPQFVGQQRIDDFVAMIREEVMFLYKNFLKTGARRVRIFIEDVKAD